VLISSNFYKQLLDAHIPKVKKDTEDLIVFFALLGSACVKVVHKNVDAIDTNRQFHQHFMRAFFVQIFRQSQNVTRKSCQNDVRTKNSYLKTLMKLTPTLILLPP